jgi:hypothetical protein
MIPASDAQCGADLIPPVLEEEEEVVAVLLMAAVLFMAAVIACNSAMRCDTDGWCVQELKDYGFVLHPPPVQEHR